MKIHVDALKKVLRKAYPAGKIGWYALENVFTPEELLKTVAYFPL